MTVQALDRGLRVLEQLGDVPDGVTLTDLAERLDLKLPTVHNLLQTLVARGYAVKRDRPRRYALGPQAAALGGRDAFAADDRDVLLDVFKRLAVDQPRARWTWVQGVGPEVVTLLRFTTDRPGRPEQGLLQRMNPYATASGVLHQALWPAERREAGRRLWPFISYGAHVWGRLADFDEHLQTVRDAGISAPRFDRDSAWRLAAPVIDPQGRLLGNVGAYHPNRRGLPARQLTHAATAAAQTLAGSLHAALPTPPDT